MVKNSVAIMLKQKSTASLDKMKEKPSSKVQPLSYESLIILKSQISSPPQDQLSHDNPNIVKSKSSTNLPLKELNRHLKDV